MRSTPPTLTYFATHFANGHTRRVAVSLPYIACIADDPHYATPPPPLPEPEPPALTRPSRWSEKLIRRTMGRDRENTARLRQQLATRRRSDASTVGACSNGGAVTEAAFEAEPGTKF